MCCLPYSARQNRLLYSLSRSLALSVCLCSLYVCVSLSLSLYLALCSSGRDILKLYFKGFRSSTLFVPIPYHTCLRKRSSGRTKLHKLWRDATVCLRTRPSQPARKVYTELPSNHRRVPCRRPWPCGRVFLNRRFDGAIPQ